jgi:hypothetical protein
MLVIPATRRRIKIQGQLGKVSKLLSQKNIQKNGEATDSIPLCTKN